MVPNIVKVTVHILVTTPLAIPFVYKKVGSHYPSENQGKIISSLIVFHRKFCFDFISFAGSFSFFDTLLRRIPPSSTWTSSIINLMVPKGSKPEGGLNFQALSFSKYAVDSVTEYSPKICKKNPGGTYPDLYVAICEQKKCGKGSKISLGKRSTHRKKGL